MRKLLIIFIVGLMSLANIRAAQAEYYVLDIEGTHAFIQFKIKHLGFSWLYGQFNHFSGHFNYDEANPSASKVNITIDTNSLDSNHAKRDKHLRGEDFLDVKKFPTSTFLSTSFKEIGEGKAVLQGNLTLHGVTKSITLNIDHMGHGKDPWGGYRRGFYGVTSIKPAEFGLKGMDKLGPHSTELLLEFSMEGIRQ